jgi:hypothetical protein
MVELHAASSTGYIQWNTPFFSNVALHEGRIAKFFMRKKFHEGQDGGKPLIKNLFWSLLGGAQL